MHVLRAFFLRHRAMAFALVALALTMKALMPTGYMIGDDARALTIRICDGIADSSPTPSVVIAIKTSHSDAAKTAHDQQACPFSALALGGLGGADLIQLALALGFILLLGFVAVPGLALRHPARLRPPLRAPPLPA